MSHTPGPWRYIKDTKTPDVFALVIPFPEGYPSSGLTEADARLVAAAPDLLSAVRRAVRLLEQAKGQAIVHSALIECRAAIAKAEGLS